MTDSPRPSDLGRRADRLAEAGDWRELHALLDGRDPDRVRSDTRLAYRLGEALYHTGRLRDLDAFARSFATAARQRADAGGILRALNLGFIAAFELGDVARAKRRGEKMVELAEAEGDDEMLARALHNLGLADNLRGESDRALAQYRLAGPVYERIGHVRGLAQLQHNVGISCRDLGRLEEAAEAYRSAVRLARDIGYRPLTIISTAGQADVRLRQGDAAMALAVVERSVEEARDFGNPAFLAEALRVRGLARAAGPEARPKDALSDLERARELGREVGHRLLVAEIDRDMAEVLDGLGRSGEADERRTRALETFEAMGAEGEASALRSRRSDDG